MTFLNNTDFLNTNILFTLGIGTTIFLGGIIFYKFFSRNNISDINDIATDSSASSIVIIDDTTSTIKEKSSESTVKILDKYLISNNDLTSNNDTVFHSIVDGTIHNTDRVDVGVNTENSNFFNCNFFNKILEWYKADGTPPTITGTSPIDENAKLDQLAKYLDGLNDNSFIDSNNPTSSINSANIDFNNLNISDVDFLPKTSTVNTPEINWYDDTVLSLTNIPLPDSTVISPINLPLTENLIPVVSDTVISPINIPSLETLIPVVSDTVLSPTNIPLPDSPISIISDTVLSATNIPSLETLIPVVSDNVLLATNIPLTDSPLIPFVVDAVLLTTHIPLTDSPIPVVVDTLQQRIDLFLGYANIDLLLLYI